MAFQVQTETGLFLTFMKSSIFWRGWKRTLSFIHDVDTNNRLSGQDTLVKDCSQNINGVNQSSATTLFPNSIPAIIEHTLKNADITQPKHRVKIQEENGTFNVATPFDLQVEDECENPIMLEWENELGANEQYLFNFNQEINEISEVGSIIEPPVIDDFETVTSAIGRDFQDTSQFITCFADYIAAENLRALHFLKVSEKVFIWLTKDGSKKQQVIIEDTYSTPYTSKGVLFLFDVKIRLPKNYDWFKVKEY